MSHFLTDIAIDIADFQKNPINAFKQGDGKVVTVLDGDAPAFYCIPPNIYESLINELEDAELTQVADQRSKDKRIPISLDQLSPKT